MALYFGTALVSEIRGKLGNNIFYNWRNLLVVKSAEIAVTDPNSLPQQAIRASFGC
jgi:hypothetical protein